MNARLLLVLLFVLAHTVTAATAQTTASGARVRFANLYSGSRARGRWGKHAIAPAFGMARIEY